MRCRPSKQWCDDDDTLVVTLDSWFRLYVSGRVAMDTQKMQQLRLASGCHWNRETLVYMFVVWILLNGCFSTVFPRSRSVCVVVRFSVRMCVCVCGAFCLLCFCGCLWRSNCCCLGGKFVGSEKRPTISDTHRVRSRTYFLAVPNATKEQRNTAKLRFAFWVENWMANGKPKSQIIQPTVMWNQTAKLARIR